MGHCDTSKNHYYSIKIFFLFTPLPNPIPDCIYSIYTHTLHTDDRGINSCNKFALHSVGLGKIIDSTWKHGIMPNQCNLNMLHLILSVRTSGNSDRQYEG